MRRFLSRYPDGRGQVLSDPTHYPNLLWWADVSSIVGAADGSFHTVIPVYPGTPTVSNGVNLSLHGELGGGAIYRSITSPMPSGAPVMDFRGTFSGGNQTAPGPSFSNQGVAFSPYASNATAPITLYWRFWQYPLMKLGDNEVLSFDRVDSCPDLQEVSISDLNVWHANWYGSTFNVGCNAPHVIAATVSTTGGAGTAVYLDGSLTSVPIGTSAVTITFETDNPGFGYQFGNRSGNPTIESQFGLSTWLAYQAFHTPAQVAAISAWLNAKR